MPDVETMARMYAALSATNEAILKARSPQELYQRVCEAAVEGGGIRSAAALFADEQGNLHFEAAIGFRLALDKVQLSVRADSMMGCGLCGNAFRQGASQVVNDFQSEPRLAHWRNAQSLRDVGSAAAVPLMRDGKSIGVFLFLLRREGALVAEVLTLMERMVANVSFALEMFERDRHRARQSATTGA